MHKLVPDWRDRALGVNAWRTKGAYERREPSRVRQIVRDTGCSTVIALGRDVQRELGIYDAPHLTWVLTKVGSREISVLTLPHPSGLNRWWNDSSNARRAKIVLHEALDNSLRV